MENTDRIIHLLEKEYPDAETELNFNTPFELLVATILSAQTTDKQVNKVTESLFAKYNKPEDFVKLDVRELQKEISTIGLYRNKSKYLIKASRILLDRFNGKVPENRKDLMTLPGVGRKTANVLLTCAFNKNAIAVDTHVFRVSNRIGLANTNRVNEVEKKLMEIVPEEKWSDMHHWLIYHGRRICKAQNPDCENCVLKRHCKYYQKIGSDENLKKS